MGQLAELVTDKYFFAVCLFKRVLPFCSFFYIYELEKTQIKCVVFYIPDYITFQKVTLPSLVTLFTVKYRLYFAASSKHVKTLD